MSERDSFLLAAALCRRYALQLSSIPLWSDVALECAAIIEDAAELVPTATENRMVACQELFDAVSK